ncbi:hypothetical protein FB562_1830 [Homoserinimonas aerilata]|uniref:Cysteine-rich secretory family protein n=1 Tax=Homoserinimonas aerilata TaxID=1162970 RepID=A0A542YKZ7_9MICO|nr:hypothetical protein [Homoserinimonas aerilata]TQL48731.1 hypothetical protein FB562_1830 [Homoserinimonas aerilata]
MKRSAIVVAIFSAVLTLVLPFVGGSGPSLFAAPASATAREAAQPIFATHVVDADELEAGRTVIDVATADRLATQIADDAELRAERQAELTVDTEHLAQRPVPVPVVVPEQQAQQQDASGASDRRAAAEAVGMSCPGSIGGVTGGAPARSAGGGLITGTTAGDLAAFASQYNAIRVANCLQPVPVENIRYDGCMEDRLIWMAEDPSDDPLSAWGHIGSARSDGAPSVGCDGNLAGGNGDTGASVAGKWWDSAAHRASLYKPDYAGATAGVCIYFAATHGGVGTSVNEPASFVRAAARWGGC